MPIEKAKTEFRVDHENDPFIIARYGDDNAVIYLRIDHANKFSWHKDKAMASEFSSQECSQIIRDAETRGIKKPYSIRI